MNKESVVIAGECLRFIMLLQTHSNTDELQRGFMSLFLEAVFVVFSKTSDVSQEVLEVRNVAVRLVSHLAQLPSSAVHFKDVLLSLPATQRQQLQDIIRASVSKDNALPKPKSLVPPMDIKLPAPVVATPEKVTSSADMVKAEAMSTVPTSFNQASTVESGIAKENDKEEDEDDDDDDWDTFQSFPASTNIEKPESKTETTAEEEPDIPESSSVQDDESNETNTSLLAEEADSKHLASDHPADITSEEEKVEPCLIEESLTSQNDKTLSDDHPVESNEQSVESKSSEPEHIGDDIKLPSTEADSPTVDDISDDQEPQQFQKSLDDESSKEHVGADVVVTEQTVADNKSED